MLTQDFPVDGGQEVALEETDDAGDQRRGDTRAHQGVSQLIGSQLLSLGLGNVEVQQPTAGNEGGNEASARRLVATPESHDREDAQNRHERVGRHAAQDRVQVGGAQVLGVERCQLRNLVHIGETGRSRCAEELRGGAGAVTRQRGLRNGLDHRGNNDASHAQNRQLAQSIECTELHQDHGDDVVAPRDLVSVVQVPLGNFWLVVPAQQQPQAE